MTTIETIARDHYLPEKRARRRATTVEGYESSIRLHVLPAFGSMEIAEITRAGAPIICGNVDFSLLVSENGTIDALGDPSSAYASVIGVWCVADG